MTWQTLLAAALGVVAGLALARPDAGSLAVAGKEVCALVGAAFAAWMRALAVASVVSGVVLGLSGLEPMRGLKRLLGKTAAWIAASSLLAVVVAMWVALGVSTRFPALMFTQATDFGGAARDPRLASVLNWGWLGLVGLCLGIGYYRNEIEEGHARLLGAFLSGIGGNAGAHAGPDAAVAAGGHLRAAGFGNHVAGFVRLASDGGHLLAVAGGSADRLGHLWAGAAAGGAVGADADQPFEVSRHDGARDDRGVDRAFGGRGAAVGARRRAAAGWSHQPDRQRHAAAVRRAAPRRPGARVGGGRGFAQPAQRCERRSRDARRHPGGGLGDRLRGGGR